MNEQATERSRRLAELCRKYDIVILYVFGSRSREVWEWLHGTRDTLAPGPSDVDIGVKPRPGKRLSVRDKVNLALDLEDLFGVSRVDLISLDEADAFLALNIIRGERLYAEDEYLADEYDLYVMRRAADYAFWERQRIAMILGLDDENQWLRDHPEKLNEGSL